MLNKFFGDDFNRLFIGFDTLVERAAGLAEQSTKLMSNYPPYNIKKLADNKYAIELAVAGFSKHDIEIELADDTLVIKGTSNNDIDYDSSIIFQGLASRAFTRSFNVADNIKINNATMLNGILKIVLEAVIPEHKKPVKIEIQDNEPLAQETNTAEFLAEKKGK